MIPEHVEFVPDIPCGFDGRASFDLYWHTEGRPTPAIVWIHGGGWLGGSRRDDNPALALLRDGYAVLATDYRLSDEAAFPAQLHDCRRAVRWLRRSGHLFNVNPRRIGAWGASAGGHLAALLGMAHDALREPGRRFTLSARVQAVCDWFGPTDFLRMNDSPGAIDHDSPDSPESRLVGGPIREHPDRVAAANPATYVTAKSAPFLIAHGSEDDVVLPSQSEILHAALTSAGVESELMVLDGAGHGFGPDHIDAAIAGAREFFGRHLRARSR